MQTSVTFAAILPVLMLGGCGEVGMCSKTSLDSHDSPTGRYSVEIVSADCVGTSKAKWVVLHKLDGAFRGSKAVAVFDDSDPDADVAVSARWLSDRMVVIHAHGAKVWSFQPNWHDVRVVDK